MTVDLSERGVLTSQFVKTHSTDDARYEPVLISTEGDVYKVHEENPGFSNIDNTFSGDFGHIVEYAPQDFFEKYGDESKMVTLKEYKLEASSVNGLRDDVMHHAADLYNKAVGFGLASDEVKYTGRDNYGRIERELSKKLQNNDDVPDVVKEQINGLRGESSDLKHLGGAMRARLKDIQADLGEDKHTAPLAGLTQ